MNRRRGQIAFLLVHTYGALLALAAFGLHAGAAIYHGRKARDL